MDPGDIEGYYRDAIHRMTPVERFERCCALYTFMKRALSLQIAQDHPDWSADEVKWHVAKRMYLTDRGAQELLALAKDPAQRERP
jgi:hypothetical protein